MLPDFSWRSHSKAASYYGATIDLRKWRNSYHPAAPATRYSGFVIEPATWIAFRLFPLRSTANTIPPAQYLWDRFGLTYFCCSLPSFVPCFCLGVRYYLRNSQSLFVVRENCLPCNWGNFVWGLRAAGLGRVSSFNRWSFGERRTKKGHSPIVWSWIFIDTFVNFDVYHASRVCFGRQTAAALFAEIKVMTEASGLFLTHLDLVHPTNVNCANFRPLFLTGRHTLPLYQGLFMPTIFCSCHTNQKLRGPVTFFGSSEPSKSPHILRRYYLGNFLPPRNYKP